MPTLTNQEKETLMLAGEQKSAGGFIEEWTARWKEESLAGVRSITEEIPPKEWDSFFATFTYRHPNWPVTIEQVGPDMGYRMQAGKQPLAGIAARPGDDGRVLLISLAKPAEASSCFTVSVAVHMWLKRSENGVDEALEIEDAGGTVTLVHLCPEEFGQNPSPGSLRSPPSSAGEGWG